MEKSPAGTKGKMLWENEMWLALCSCVPSQVRLIVFGWEEDTLSGIRETY